SMKKTIEFDGRQFRLTRSVWPAVAAVVVLAASLAWIAWYQTNKNVELSHATGFEQQYAFRTEQIGRVLNSKTAVLNAVATLIPLLPELDQAIFSERMGPVLQDIDAEFMCWHDLNRQQTLRHPVGAPGCDAFVLFRTTTRLRESSTDFLVSLPAGGNNTPRSGFLSINLDFGGIKTEPGRDQHQEYLYIRDRNALSMDRFRITREGLEPLSIDQRTTTQRQKIANLLNFEDIELIYDIHFDQPNSPVPLLTALAVSLSTLLLGGSVIFFWWKNRILDNQIFQRTEELRQFAYRAAHDLKSPLTSIRQLANFLKEDAEQGRTDAIPDNVARIAAQSHNLEKLLEDLYDLSVDRPNSDDAQTFDTQQLIDEILNRHTAMITEKQVDTQVILEHQEIRGLPRTRLAQMLDNLITNALKYTDPLSAEPPKIAVGVLQKGDQLLLEVADNGVGFGEAFYSEDSIELFKRYRPDLASGTGVGLSIIARHVFQLRGRITFEPLHPGTRVTVILPYSGGG
ncbi:MAG: HAMP domain-containing sensor histidine kinase, partial [Pseudomonadota bacterium]